jgi:nucleoside-diphosphate-sugar epimerase
MKRVLVTGASGFIGQHCLPSLVTNNFDVHAISSKPPGRLQADVTWHQTDLLNGKETKRLLGKVKATHLLHLAWYATPGKFWTSNENLRWLQAGIDLLEAFAENGGRRLVAAGSCAEYEWGREESCSEASTPLSPATLYGACKHAFRTLLEPYAQLQDLSWAWGRIFFLYGPHEPESKLVASVVRALLQGQPAKCSHGRQVRDFLYIEDVADAFVTLLKSDLRGPINIGSGKPVSLREVLAEIGEQLNAQDLIHLDAVPPAPAEPSVLVADVSRLTNELKWRAKYDLHRGIEKTIEWWRANLMTSQEGLSRTRV